MKEARVGLGNHILFKELLFKIRNGDWLAKVITLASIAT